MPETRFPNRWFGSNPQAIPNHGRQLHGWSDELPKDWRSAFEEPQSSNNDDADTSED